MKDGAIILSRVCKAIDEGQPIRAAELLDSELPFQPLTANLRRYSPIQSRQRLVFPGALRLLSHLLPAQFPFHTNWKTDSCHLAFYELFPTIDHVVPISRGGEDEAHNWVCTSMLKNAAKANFTIEELGWRLHPIGNLEAWDGLTVWFLRQYRERQESHAIGCLRRWATVAATAHHKMEVQKRTIP